MKPGPMVAFAVILGSLGLGARALVANLTPYLPFAEAKTAGRTVQVMGKLDKAAGVHQDGGLLRFTLIEESTGMKLPVAFKMAKPQSFDQAIQITAIGEYKNDVFAADNLLVKCPSKYQGKEAEEKSYSAK